MILFRIRISLSPACRREAVRSLQRVLGPTRALPGCVSYQLCADVEHENVLMLIGEWADVQSLRNYLRMDSFTVVLSALDYASEQPEVRFDTIVSNKGMDFIGICRKG